MRIHLPLHPAQFAPDDAGASSTHSPIIQLGGEIVLVELQGELSYEGDKENGVIGVIGLDRPDKPTLHLGAHHLLHGKFAKLQKPCAVIRRVVGDPASTSALAVEGDAAAEEDDGEGDGNRDGGDEDEEEEEEEEERLFEPNPDSLATPTRTSKNASRHVPSSSPISVPRTPMDYSSELDMSSPARSATDDFGFPMFRVGQDAGDFDHEQDDDSSRKGKRALAEVQPAGTSKKRKGDASGERERTRHYEVVGIVRKKVVFALRPEPLVAPTMLPE
ncbi:hypothetical protein IAU60_006513 [Kwoniella sp. DSM 27419]